MGRVMAMTDDGLARARAAFDHMAWADVVAILSDDARQATILAADLDRWATAAFLVGRPDESISAWTRGHVRAVESGDVAMAIRCAVSVGLTLIARGDFAPGSGWLGRAERLVTDTGFDGVERFWPLIPRAMMTLFGGDPAGAYPLFAQANDAGARFHDADLTALARLGLGHSLVAQSETDAGLSLLDEAMASIMTGEVTPIVAGMVYCAVIETCDRTFDIRRAQQWTAALDRWTEAQPDLVPYRGQCLVYRARLMRLHGDWQDAFDAADRARDWLSRPPPDEAVGDALYELADLERLRGDYGSAERTYREASSWGRAAEPGLALLRLAQGRLDLAGRSLTRALAETEDDMVAARLLTARIDVLVATGDFESARVDADRVRSIATVVDVPMLTAIADSADGVVRLADGDITGALAVLHRAFGSWQTLEAPYEAARIRVLLGRACLAVSDREGARLAFDGAREVFVALGAEPDRIRVDALAGRRGEGGPAGLSPRELEVLRLVAAGQTNREIADELGISERTVDRHVSNIYTKLDVSSRAAATASAIEHGLR
jgi:DNA-binding CsgD family transcriptional regulator/tetratricopeptide (TPR) repeat protein